MVDPEPDHDGDGDPGLSIKQSDRRYDETAPDKYQHWHYTPGSDWRLDGPATLTLWSAIDGFDGEATGHVEVWIDDCPPVGSCTTLLNADWHREEWTADADDWHRRTFDVGDLDTTIVAGNALRLRMMHGHNDLWVALSGDRPSSLTVTPG